jgi:large subunit ribosomal protein L10
LDRQEKKVFSESFKALRDEYPVFFVITPQGLPSDAIMGFRRELNEVNASMKVVKNTLFKKSLDHSSAGDSFLSELFSGPSAVVFGHDPVSISKALVEFQKKHAKNVEILGGTLDSQVVRAEDIKNLSTMPSIEQLRGQLLSVLSAPASKLASLLKEAQRCAVRVLSARCEKTDSTN